MRRVFVYVDGFNLYHAINELRDDSLKWLCLRRLSESMISEREELESVKYFSAYATWIPDAHKRHRAYVAALKAEGGQIHSGAIQKEISKVQGVPRTISNSRRKRDRRQHWNSPDP